MNATHTPTPWSVDLEDCYTILGREPAAHGQEIVLCLMGDEFTATYGPYDKANAEHIVKCVNAHDDLVTLLLRAADALNDLADPLGKEIDEYLIRIHHSTSKEPQ